MLKSFALQNLWPVSLSRPKKIKFQGIKKAASGYVFYVSLALVICNVVLLASYIYGVNNYASKGYEIRSMEAKVADLNTTIKDLNLKIAKATSMATIQNDFAALNFSPAGTPKFLKVPGQVSLK